MTLNLKPCPICGGRAGVSFLNDEPRVGCAGAVNGTCIAIDWEETVEAWNGRKRVTPTAHQGQGPSGDEGERP